MGNAASGPPFRPDAFLRNAGLRAGSFLCRPRRELAEYKGLPDLELSRHGERRYE
jgi:hypothetical protein